MRKFMDENFLLKNEAAVRLLHELGRFAEGGIPGKMQFGSAWWFNDTRDGMEAQIKALGSEFIHPGS